MLEDVFNERILRLQVASGDALDVREFRVVERISCPFAIDVVALSPSADVDFEGAIAKAASFEMRRRSLGGEPRKWSGVVASAQQLRVESDGLSTYAFRLVPRLWLLGQRTNYRIFQDQSELDIARTILGEWGIEHRFDGAPSYTPRRYRTQYRETDLAFVSRMLEDIGVSYWFESSGEATTMVLGDAPNRREPRAPLPFFDTPNAQTRSEYVTRVVVSREVQPGKFTQSDVDYRRQLLAPLEASSSGGDSAESALETYVHDYGAFLWKGGGGGNTPHADDRGAARTDEGKGAVQTQMRLDSVRVRASSLSFATSAYDVAPGTVVRIVDHPRGSVAAPWLVESVLIRGTIEGEWSMDCQALAAATDYRPACDTPRPRTMGIESATVTGPAGEEIHTDELGRVRVKFHWDRAGTADQSSSCWVPVNQPWAGAGFGALNIPRVGQEVIVDFLGSDPDRPIVLGRVFTVTTPPPYELPKYKTVSGMRSETYPRPKESAAGQGRTLAATDDVFRARRRPARLRRDVTSATEGIDLPGGARGTVPGTLEPGQGGPSSSRIDPGVFGAMAAPLEETVGEVTGMRAQGPDGQDTRRSANGLTFEDQAGSERAYLQAQKDLGISVRNNMTGVVGANRGFAVLGNDFERIKGFQTTEVGRDRNVEVVGHQTHIVHKDIVRISRQSQRIFSKNDFTSVTETGSHAFLSKKSEVHAVDGKSFIMMFPDAIVIEAPTVYINPGPVFIQAIQEGKSAAEAKAESDAKAKADADAKQRAEQEPRAKQAATEALANPEMSKLKNVEARKGLFRAGLENGGVTNPGLQNSLVEQYSKELSTPGFRGPN
jgi:type VI secretion system VgrG family protein